MIRKVVSALPLTNILLVVAGAALVVIVGPLVMLSAGLWQDWWDRANPVAIASVAHVERPDPTTLRLQLWVTRKRDCEALKMVGLTGESPETMLGATTMRREDNAQPLSYPAGVRILSQPWLLSPVYGHHLQIYGYYDCDGRIVKQRIVDEVLQ